LNHTAADVLVVGAGPAGATLSLRLSRIGCSVVLLERSVFDEFRVGESLPPAAAERLQRLGVWEAFLETCPVPVHGVQSAWGNEELDSSTFLGDPLLNGWHLDRPLFDAMLTSAEHAGACVFRRTCARDIEPPGNHWSVTASSPEGEFRIHSRFFVDATGRSARLCQRMGIGRLRSDRLIGISAIFENIATPETLPSRIESHPLGWWYSAGLPGGRAIAIFFTDSDLCARHGLTCPVALSRLLKDSPHTNERFDAYVPTRLLQVFPAASHRLDCGAGDSWLAIGDALIGRDPLSSSGIDFALASAERASSVLSALANGHNESVDAYNTEVRADFGAYLQQRRAYYAMERRWPDSTFWRRRHFTLAEGGSSGYSLHDSNAVGLEGRDSGLPISIQSPRKPSRAEYHELPLLPALI
jgi:flavin-dependent dehydrogenase